MRRSHFALLQLAVWTAYGAIHFAASLPAVDESELWDLAGWKAIRAFTGGLVSSALPWVYRRLPGSLERVTWTALKVATVSYGLGMVWIVLDRSLLVAVAAATALEVSWARFPRGLELDYILALLAWSIGYVAARYWLLAATRQREALEQQIAVRDARLEALTARLQPHFLFNALNSVRALVTEDGERAREMITRLASLLRYSLAAPELATVARELEAVRAYLAIQSVRFEDRLEAAIVSCARAERCLVPPLLLQPLVENAVEHGCVPPDGPLRVEVRAELVGSTLRMEVTSPGTLAPAGSAGAGGAPHGLANVSARLAAVFGDRQSLSLEQRGGLVVATIEVREAPLVEAARADR